MKRLLFALMLLATPLHATPPNIIRLSDRVIGLSETQIFILRETADNLGLHIYGMHDVYLVAKNIETGQDEVIWPVYRVHAAEDSTPQARSFALNDAVNPYEVLAKNNAIIIHRGFAPPVPRLTPEGDYDDRALLLVDTDLPADNILLQLVGAIDKTASAIQPYPDGGYASTTNTTPRELLRAPALILPECRVNGLMTLFRYPAPNVDLARVRCDDGGERLSLSLVVVIPAAE